jgi:hypothetical protein
MQPDLFDTRITPERVLAALRERRGVEAGISAREFVRVLTGDQGAGMERQLRSVIEALRTAGHGVCATPDTGYFLADNEDELDRTCEFLLARAMTSLRQIAGVKRVSLPDLRGQLRLPISGVKP